MVSGDSPPPMTTSIPPGFDISEDMRPGKTTPTNIPLTPLKSYKTNGDVPNEDIEEAVPIVKCLPVPEPQPKIEKNCFDYDHTDGKQLVGDVEDDACFVKCVYFTQQCCECTILWFFSFNGVKKINPGRQCDECEHFYDLNIPENLNLIQF